MRRSKGEGHTRCFESVVNGVYLEKQVEVSNCLSKLGNRDHKNCHDLKKNKSKGTYPGVQRSH